MTTITKQSSSMSDETTTTVADASTVSTTTVSTDSGWFELECCSREEKAGTGEKEALLMVGISLIRLQLRLPLISPQRQSPLLQFPSLRNKRAFAHFSLLEQIQIIATVSIATQTTTSCLDLPDFCFSDCRQLQQVEMKLILQNDKEKETISHDTPATTTTDTAATVTIIIGNHAFHRNTNLQRFTIYTPSPTTTPEQADDHSSSSSSLTSVSDKPHFDIESIGSGAFSHCANLTTLDFLTTHEHSSSQRHKNNQYFPLQHLRDIGEFAFCRCEALTIADLRHANLLCTLERATFQGCATLKRIQLPNTIQVIANYVFWGCHELHHVSALTTPSSSTSSLCLKSIGECAFQHCHKLQHVFLPASLEILHWRAFRKCKRLEQITFALPIKTTSTTASVANDTTTSGPNQHQQ